MITISNEEFANLNREYRDQIQIDRKLDEAADLVGLSDIKIIVLDDDPTGTQTVHDVLIYTSWGIDVINDIFNSAAHMAFILTNSRSFSEKKTQSVHRMIADNCAAVSHELKIPFILISRSDSTLRGHFPIETEALKEGLEAHGNIIDGEIICPYFSEGNRFTINNIHFIHETSGLMPVSESDYAKDKTFSYHHSHLGEWCEEKTKGAYLSKSMIYISIDELRKQDYIGIQAKLESCHDFNKVIVNAINQYDLKIFITAYLKALHMGHHFIFRSAAAIPKVLGQCCDIPYLNKTKLKDGTNHNGGLIIVGSHVNKTTSQLKQLEALDGTLLTMIEFNQHLILSNHFDEEIKRVSKTAEAAISAGKTAVIYTNRKRIDLPEGTREAQLQLAVQISDALVEIVSAVKAKPSYILTKGGITSSDIAVKALNIKKAVVLGQIKPAVPVWQANNTSHFSGLNLIIFPGNVGDENTLKEIIELLA